MGLSGWDVVDVRVDDLARGEDATAQAPPLAVDVLGRRIDDHVGAEIERLLQQRRREHVVDHHFRAGLVGDLGDRRDIEDFELRIGRRLEEADLRVRPHRRAPLAVEIHFIDQGRLDAERRQPFLDDVEAGTEQRAARHDVIAGA